MTIKYEKWYNQIIFKAKNRNLDDNTTYEKHHIIPKSLGGDDSKENLVHLTLREHYICHVLLVKFLSGHNKYKMLCAINRMNNTPKYKMNSRIYENLRLQFIEKFMENHPSKNEEWVKKLSDAIKQHWLNDEIRKQSASEKMKTLWETGKLKPKVGQNNGMYNKEPWNKNKKFPGTGKKGSDNPSAKKYTILTPSGSTIVTKCLKTFCEENSLNYMCMKKVSQGKNKQHNGYYILRKEGQHE